MISIKIILLIFVKYSSYKKGCYVSGERNIDWMEKAGGVVFQGKSVCWIDKVSVFWGKEVIG